MTHFRLGSTAGLTLLLITATATPAQRNPLAGLDQYIEQARQDWGIAGLAVAVVKNDSVVYAKGFGVREAGKPERVDERTLFAIGSNTKAFTSAAVGMLVDEGKLSLNDPVTTHLPYFQMFDPYVTREMTVRDLLTHRSGLARGDALWYASPLSRREIIERVRYLEPSWGFRSQYGYQNIMFLAAGEVVAAVSGMSWDDFTKRRIFQPLGMTTSNTSTNDFRPGANVAQPHFKVQGKPQPIPWRNIDNVAPAGSINSNVLEMTSWMRMLLNYGTFNGKRLLSERYIREMTRPQMISGAGAAADTTPGASFFSTYGLGLGVRDYYGRKLVSHGGGIDGMLSTFSFIPQERLGVVVLTNTEGQNLGGALANYILNLYLGVPQRDLSRMALNNARRAQQRADSSRRAVEARRVTGTKPSLALDRYVGRYENRLYGEARVALEGGTLVLRRGPAYNGKLEHWHFDTFRADWGHPRMGTTFITFALDADAKVARMTIDGLGEFRRAADRPAAATSER